MRGAGRRACSRPLTTGRRASCRRGGLQRLPAARPRGVERWEDWLDAWSPDSATSTPSARARRAAAGRGVTAGEAWLRAAVAYHFAQVRLGARRRARARRGRRARVAALYEAHALLDADGERIEAPLDGGTIVGNLRRPAGVDRPPLVAADPGPRLHQGGVLPAGGRLPRARDGDAVARRPGPGRDAATRCRSAPTTRSRSRAMLDALDGRGDLDLDRVGALGVSLGGYYAPRAAAFEPRIRAVAGISGPFDFGAIWDAPARRSRARRSRTSRARRDAEEARERAASSTSTACSSGSTRRRCSSPASSTG